MAGWDSAGRRCRHLTRNLFRPARVAKSPSLQITNGFTRSPGTLSREAGTMATGQFSRREPQGLGGTVLTAPHPQRRFSSLKTAQLAA